MYWCDKCKIWEHEKCLIDAIRKEYVKSNPQSATTAKKSRKSLGKNVYINIATNEETGEVTAYIDDQEQKANRESEGTGDQKLEPDTNGVKTTIAVKCLQCGTQLK